MGQINPLTGLRFGDAYFKEVENYLETTKSKMDCIMAMDVEHFCLYNQLQGRAEGDKLLITISRILQNYVKEHGGVVGYLGGDNFAIVTDFQKETLRSLRLEIRQELRNITKTTGYPVAFGLYKIEDKTEAAREMYNRAVVALSHVLGNYTSRCCEYYPDMDGKEEEEIRLLTEIQEGIEKDEFTFFIQPQFDIFKSKIVGGESLVRWIHGEKGMVSPGVFIPVLEKNGFIADLDQIVWEKVCKWLRECIDKGYKPVPISVNVSRIDIFTIDVPEFLISLVEKYDLPAELLKIEITESAYAEDSKKIIEAIDCLRDYGFIVMMDDFGSGYSSLNLLKSVPVDVLKMDMRFLEINENEEEKGIGILESVVNMARQLRIPIVVEGVETQSQENLLKRMSCCYTQGFFYYRPMSLAAFEELLIDENNLDHSGLWYRQAESVHLREFLDTSLFSDEVINNILGPTVFYEVYDNQIEVTRVNEQYFRLLGVEREEQENYRQRFWSRVMDDDIQTLYGIFEKAYKNPTKGGSGFINIMGQKEQILWINIRIFFLREKDGHKLFYASFTDMTELRDNKQEVKSFEKKHIDISQEQIALMEQFYGNFPNGFAMGKPILDEEGKAIDYTIYYANKALIYSGGGDMKNLMSFQEKLFQERKQELIEAVYKAAYERETTLLHVYSNMSNRYWDINIYPYQDGYASCMVQDVTNSRLYSTISTTIMDSFREIYFIHLQNNYCRMLHPNENDMSNRGNFEEVTRRHFENGKICLYDEKNIREFLSLDNIKRELKKRDTIEYKYKRMVRPGEEEWCLVTISVSERKEGVPKTALLTIKSIESLMREKEDMRHNNMAQMLATMSDGFFVYNAAYGEKIVFANSPVIHMFGCKDVFEFREHVKESFSGLVHPEDLPRVEWEISEQVRSSDKHLDFIRYRIIRKDGEIRWIDDVGYLETTLNGETPEMFYVFVTDITDTLPEAQKNKLIMQSKQFMTNNNE